MKKIFIIGIRLVTVLCLVLGFRLAYTEMRSSQNGTAPKGEVMANHASGAFDVKMAPQKADNAVAEAANLSRMSLDKQYHGDLEATAKGEMLATSPDAKGSGVYVALERVTGTLKGRSGSFLLHHTGIMRRGVPQLIIEVVPDSGTGQLAGLSGKMNINIAAGGKHSYDFEYALPEAQ